ncbi:hypothetical protein IWX90DRAFT_277757 [Phyllosticta citrichinensis]|uniref:Uncharacterized protein n=1 Tax=Phyllosticta citrichinensis TaxID=1130410 RepID=A0ABR1XNC6_9PEZI
MPPAPVKDVFVPAPRFEEFEGCTRQAWLDGSPSSRGHKAWLDFKKSIHDGNRTIPRRLALSHWHSVEDFVWISENLPSLTELDLSDIQDCILVDHTTDALDYYAWEELRNAVNDKFWAQIEKLWVRHWGCTALQNSLFRHPAARDKSSDLDYRSRRDGQTRESVCDVTTIIEACSKLKVLSVRGPTVGGGLNRAWHPKKACIEEGGHAHFCALVEGLEDTAPLSVETLELHQAEIGLLLPLLAKSWTLKRIKISLAPILSRYAPGRIKEDVEDPKLEKWPKEIASRNTKDNCRQELRDKRLAGMSDGEKKRKLHEWLDSVLSISFETYPWKNPGMASKLQAVWQSPSDADISALYSYHLMEFHTSGRYAHPVSALAYDFDFIAQTQPELDKDGHFQQLTTTDSAEAYNNVPISPFTFILPDRKIQSPDEVQTMVKEAKSMGGKFEWNSIFLPLHESYPTEPMRPIDMWKALRKTAPGFAPLWDLDALMSKGFPRNQGIVAPWTPFVESIARGFMVLKRNRIPVRVLLAWRKQAPGLYWGHTEIFEISFRNLLALHVRIPESCVAENSGSSSGTATEGAQQETRKTYIAELVDELVVRYPDWAGGAPPIPGDAAAAPKAELLAKWLHREAQGWQRWWYYHALIFTSLRRLEIRMPEAFDAFHSKRLALLLLGEGNDEETAASRGKWHLRHEITEQGTHTRFVSRIWERIGGDDNIAWSADEWDKTTESFHGMAHFDREWANMHENPDNRKPKASGEQIVELENQDSAMHDDTAMLQEDGVAPEIAPS